MADGRIYIATETYSCVVDGTPQVIHKGVTRVREGHALLAQNPQYYELATDHVHFDVEQATAAPGEQRGAPGGVFNPGEHTVAEVLAYMKDASAPEAARVKTVEAHGSRKSKQITEA